MLSLALIVKNEEKNLSRCLNSVQGLYEQLIIVDTGSTDRTLEIAAAYTDQVFQFTWIQNFSAARNFSFSKCNQPWIMWLDADDILKPEDISAIREFLPKVNPSTDYVLMNYHYSVIDDRPIATQLRERIIRRDIANWSRFTENFSGSYPEDWRGWRGRCHEIIPVDWAKTQTLSNAFVWHLRDHLDIQADISRNLNIMKLEAEERPNYRNYQYLAHEFLDRGSAQEAIPWLIKAFEVCHNTEDQFQISYKLGSSHASIKDYEQAISWYMKSLRYRTEYREPLLGLAEIFILQGDFQKAAYWLEKSLDVPEPSNPPMAIYKEFYTWVPHEKLAVCYSHLGEFKKVENCLREQYKFTRNPIVLQQLNNILNLKRASYKKPSSPVRLNLGCGEKPLPNYINCDLFSGPGVDEVFSLDEIPYADGSVEAIYSEHSLEHLPRIKAENALAEWARVLKPGGLLTLKIPDLELACQSFLADPANRQKWWLHVLYGVQDHRNTKDAVFLDEVNYGQIHYTGFTKDRIRDLLVQNGFIIDQLFNYDGWDTPSIQIEAHRSSLLNLAILGDVNPSLQSQFKSRGVDVKFYNSDQELESDPNIWALIILDSSRLSIEPRKALEDRGIILLDPSELLEPSEQLVEFTCQLLSEPKKVAFINNSLQPKYLSYGDYWLDAFRAAGHQVSEFRYEQISELPAGYDLYFFIEIRYDPSQISTNATPRLLYTRENPSEVIVEQYFDAVATDSEPYFQRLKDRLKTSLIPNNNFLGQIPLLFRTVRQRRNVEQSQVDIIIPSYKSLPYLQVTLESLRRNTKNYRAIVVNSGDDVGVREYLKKQPDIILIDSEEKSSFSKSINKALNLSRNDVVLLNNDVVVGPGWLEALRVSKFDLTNPFSNCDAGWRHTYYDEVGGVSLRPGMTLDQVDLESLMSVKNPHTETVPTDWVAFYATYIKRRVIDTVGILDESFLNGGEDLDYCRRARKLGFTCGHVYSSWVFHFGGKTRKVSEEEDPQRHQREDVWNNSLASYKNRETVCIYTGPGWERWTRHTIDTTGIGGSETCAAMLAEELIKLNYRVVLIGDCQGQEANINGVEYLDFRKFDAFKRINYVDFFISSRTTDPLSHSIRNGRNFVWVHDIWLSQSGSIPNSHKVDKFICLSPWHRDFFSQHHNIPIDRIHIQGNGLNTHNYENLNLERDPYRLIYSSSPDRGLLTLLEMFPRLKSNFPELSLHVFYGFYNWEEAIKARKNPEEMAMLQKIKNLMLQDGVVYHGRVSQKQLALEQSKSSIWAYPTWFTETYCITALEAMLSGAIPVVTPVAALNTTIPDDCGVKVKNSGPAGYVEIESAIVNLLKNFERQQNYRKRGKDYVKSQCSWESVARQWHRLFESYKKV